MNYNWIKTKDGPFIRKEYGKYRPNLLIIADKPEDYEFKFISSEEFNLSEEKELGVLRGFYFKTKKGADAFRIARNGTHLLLYSNWHGRDDNDSLLEEIDHLYRRNASSNGGGTGTEYVIIEKKKKAELKLEEL